MDIFVVVNLKFVIDYKRKIICMYVFYFKVVIIFWGW